MPHGLFLLKFATGTLQILQVATKTFSFRLKYASSAFHLLENLTSHEMHLIDIT